MKIRFASVEEAEKALTGAGFRQTRPATFECNEIYDRGDLELRRGGRLLRLREYGGQATLTYKGPAEAGRHKVREELETGVADAGQVRAMLERLGYERVFGYEKYRAEYEIEGGVGVVDETPVGVYVELEGDGEWIDKKAQAMGVGADKYVTDSYASLYLKWCAERGEEPGEMRFPGRKGE